MRLHAAPFDDADQRKLEDFAEARTDVTDMQVQRMLGVDKTSLFYEGTADLDDTQDNALVVQNPDFDLLLGMDNRPLDVAPGEIAVPLHHRHRQDLSIGDSITVRTPGIERTFTVAAFLRDSTMNPGLASSKRFLINEVDARDLEPHLGTPEMLIGFMLADGADVRLFLSDYRAADLPAAGISATKDLFRTMTLITEGAVAAVVIFGSLLLLVIAALCLRFAFLTAAEEDRREIGVMKAIGVPATTIKSIYLGKYALLAGVAAVLGYAGALAAAPPLLAGAAEYNGAPPTGPATFVAPMIPAIGVFLLLMAFTAVLLRRIDRVTALEGLQPPAAVGAGRSRMSLHRARRTPVHVRLGLMDVVGRAGAYALTGIVFLTSAFIMIVPVNMATTLADPGFIRHSGVASSDVRIDLRNNVSDMRSRYAQVLDEVAETPETGHVAGLVAAGYEALHPGDGTWSSITIENGDHSAFPIGYLEGTAPTDPGDVALSWSNANDLGLSVGSSLEVRGRGLAPGTESGDADGDADGDEEPGTAPGTVTLTVTGVYQDITNGGRTAKGMLPQDSGTPNWYVILVDLGDGGDAETIIDDWSARFAPARVTDSSEYMSQTLGETISRIRLVAALSATVAAALAGLMTILFTRMLLVRDAAAVSIQSALGADRSGLRMQYLTRMWVVLAIGVVAGTLAANLLGPPLVSSLTRLVGAVRIPFTIDPWLAYVACPMALFAVVGAAALAATFIMRPKPISTLNAD